MSELKSNRSRAALIAVVTAVLDEPGAELPSITELCVSAGLSRPTFYQHFGDVASLIEAAALERMRGLFVAVAPTPADGPWERNAPVVISALLRGLCRHQTFYRRVLTGPCAQSIHTGVVDYLSERFLTNSPLAATLHENRGADGARQAATFLAAGTAWTLTRWLLDEDPRTGLEDLSEQVATLLVAAARPTSVPPTA